MPDVVIMVLATRAQWLVIRNLLPLGLHWCDAKAYLLDNGVIKDATVQLSL